MEHIDVVLESLSVFTMQDLLYKAYGASEGSKQPRSTVFYGASLWRFCFYLNKSIKQINAAALC